MAETPEHSPPQPPPFPGTPEAVEPSKKMINCRAEIDTSPPFASVKEAVSHFESRAFWFPLHMLHQPSRNAYRVFDISKVEEQAEELERDVTMKEQETLNVLKELETAKRIVEDLKLKLQKQVSECMSAPEFGSNGYLSTPSPARMDCRSPENVTRHGSSVEGSSPSATPSPDFILTELKQAKSNLSRTTNDLAVIRASVESLNVKLLKEKVSTDNPRVRPASNSTGLSPLRLGLDPGKLNLESTNEAQLQGSSMNLTNISRELQQLNLAAEQFIGMAEASKCEVLRAMSEIENTKSSMRTAEMRWVAAKKMEEAARAVEAVALAEMKYYSNYGNSSSAPPAMPFHNDPSDGVTLSFEEYSSLSRKARKAEELSRKQVVDSMLDFEDANRLKLAMLKELGIATHEVEFSKRALEEALGRAEVGNTAKLHAKDNIQQWRLEQHKTAARPIQRPTRPKNSSFSYPHHQDSRVLFDVNRSNLIDHESKPVLRPSISLKDILGRKQIQPQEELVRDEAEEACGGTRQQKVPLSEMLRLQRGVQSAPNRDDEKHNSDHRHFFPQRRKFGFIHISLPLTKQKKMQASHSKTHNG